MVQHLGATSGATSPSKIYPGLEPSDPAKTVRMPRVSGQLSSGVVDTRQESLYNILKENKSIELQDGCSDIMDIREIMATTKSHQWADIIPLCVGHIGICNRTLNIEEAWIIPNVIGGFDFSTDLGMIHIPELDMAILRGIRPTFEALYKTTPNKVDLASLANCILKEGSGWKVRTLK